MAITVLTSNENGANSLIDINANFADLDTTKADLDSPTFTGTPSLPTGTTGVTQSASDNSTKLATTAYVDTQVNTAAFSGVRLTKSGDQTITDSNETTLSWDTETYDTDSFHEGVTNPTRITIPTTGYYLVTCNIRHSVNDADKKTLLKIVLGGSTVIGQTESRHSNATWNDGGISMSFVYYFTSTNYIEAVVRYNYGSNAITIDADTTNFSVTKLK